MAKNEADAGAPAPGQAAAVAVPSGSAVRSTDLGFVMNVPLEVTVEVGSVRMLLQEVLQLDAGSVIELDRGAEEPSDVLINGRLVARGEVTVVDDRLGVRIVELIDRPKAG